MIDLNTIKELISKLESLDITLWLEDDRLLYKAPPGALNTELRARLGEQKDDIIRFLKSNSIETIKPFPRDKDYKFPLSFSQGRYYLYRQLHPHDCFFNILTGYRITGKLDVQALKKTYHEIICRHEILRTTFPMVDGSPVQVINSPAAGNNIIREIDLQEDPGNEQPGKVEQLYDELRDRSFDIENGPLYRIVLITLARETYIMLSCLHHIICDTWSLLNFHEEFCTLYESFAAGKDSPLQPLPIQYADFTLWEHRFLTAEEFETNLDYWKRLLKEEPPQIRLPKLKSHIPVETFKAATVLREITPQLTQEVGNLGLRTGTSLFTVFLAVFVALFYGCTGGQEIILAAPYANRRHKITHQLIGPFLNLVMLRIEIKGSTGFMEFIKHVNEVFISAIDHQEIPCEHFLKSLQPERNLRHNPVYRVMLNLIPDVMENMKLNLPGITLTPMQMELRGMLRIDCGLGIIEQKAPPGRFFKLNWVYRSDIFEADSIELLADNYQALLEAITANPEQSVEELVILVERSSK